jgi:hypothetical protein
MDLHRRRSVIVRLGLPGGARAEDLAGMRVSDWDTKAMMSSKRWCMVPEWPRLHSSPLTRATIVRS